MSEQNSQNLRSNAKGQPQHVRLKLIGDDKFIEQVRRFASQEPDKLQVESEGKDDDPTRLGFDLMSVSALIVIVKGALLAGDLGMRIWRWMQISEANKIVIQTPFETIEFHKAAALTEEDVRKRLSAVMQLR